MLLKTNSDYIYINNQKNELIKNIKLELLNYFKSNSYPSQVIEDVVNEDFITSNPSYYLYYPYLFNKYFQIEDKEFLNLLSISGFLYYKAIILIDDIFDNKNSENNFEKFFLANIYQEETIKILSSLFPLHSEFWETWNNRKLEYTKAFHLDKNMKSIKEFSEFERLADYKSAFGKIAIDCLYYLSEKKHIDVYNALLESHKFFYTSFQIMDDIKDYTEDIKNEQFNISRQELTNTLSKENDDINNYSLEDQKKLIYLKGVAENLYIKATDSLNKSKQFLENFKTKEYNLWNHEIDCLYNVGVNHFLNIEGFIDVYKSNTKLSHDIIDEESLNKIIESANNFLESNQLLDGSWKDVFNDAGVSDVWTTCYTAYSLGEITSKTIIKHAENYIIKHQHPSGLWSYNKRWVNDADSSSFALLSLKNENEIIQDCINKWLKFQNKDGGFSTYNDKNILLSSLNSPNIEDVEGWLQSHFCVSAVSLLVFVELDITSKDEFKKLKDYLIKKLKSKDKTISYWWSKDTYAIYFILLAAVKSNNREIISLAEKKIDQLNKDEDLNFFFKGFLLKALCLTDNLYYKNEKRIKTLVTEISSNQFTDGSWLESYSLRMPFPGVLNADDKSIEWKQSNKGTNIIVKDYNRVFTTVSCFSALKAYESRIR